MIKLQLTQTEVVKVQVVVVVVVVVVSPRVKRTQVVISLIVESPYTHPLRVKTVERKRTKT